MFWKHECEISVDKQDRHELDKKQQCDLRGISADVPEAVFCDLGRKGEHGAEDVVGFEYVICSAVDLSVIIEFSCSEKININEKIN